MWRRGPYRPAPNYGGIALVWALYILLPLYPLYKKEKSVQPLSSRAL